LGPAADHVKPVPPEETGKLISRIGLAAVPPTVKVPLPDAAVLLTEAVIA
jgi:hypothetical protein